MSFFYDISRHDAFELIRKLIRELADDAEELRVTFHSRGIDVDCLHRTKKTEESI